MALRAFSQLPKNLRTAHQFVLTHPSEDLDFKNKARSFGLEDDELVTTGHVTDNELIALYNRCKLFIFPSLYEGFGLPILEAMACGAPVIASNRSSIPEVIGRSDAMFDASSEQSIIEALYKGLSDDSFREELSLYGLERVKKFTWEKSALLAWNAIEDAICVRQQSGQKKISVSVVKSRSRKKIAFVSPLPPQKSGIADYSAELLPYLSKFFEIDLFIEPG